MSETSSMHQNPSVLTVVYAGTVITVCASTAVRDEDFDAYLAARWAPDARGILVLVPPGCPGPNAAQRQRGAADWHAHLGMRPLALVTSSAVHRGIMTAFAWLQGSHANRASFAPHQIDEALSFACVESWVRAHVRRVAADLASQLGVHPTSVGLGREVTEARKAERAIAS